MSVSRVFLCCVSSGLCDEVITLSDESFRVCVCMCVRACVRSRNLNNEKAEAGLGCWAIEEERG